jgi:TatD DNase family protein
MLIDSHAHLHDPKFNRDREEVIRNLKKDGIDIVINSGGGRDSNKAAVALAEKYDNIYATVGIELGKIMGVYASEEEAIEDYAWRKNIRPEHLKKLKIGM